MTTRKIVKYAHAVLFLLSNIYILNAQTNKDSLKTIFGLVKGLETLDLKTGDIALFQSLTFDGIMTQIGTFSPFTHSAIIIKNPDGTLWLTHATDNDYNGDRIKVIGEDKGRPGVILTKMEDSFLSKDNGRSGFYRRIWIRRFDETWSKRPERDTLLKLYKKYKKNPFTTTKYPFILAALDFSLFGKDLLSLPDDATFICSEYVHRILRETGVPVSCYQKENEYTPKDIRNLEPYCNGKSIVFKFENGMYMMK